MKMNHLSRLICQILPAILLPFSAFDGRAATNEPPVEFPHMVPFELGEAEFAAGDVITIQQVRGTSQTIKPGEKICVEGKYTLNSREIADLALFVTTTNQVSTPIEAAQVIRIEKGSGSFRLIETMTVTGYPHVSFYSVSPGAPFGGVYFGQGKWVLRHKGFSYLDKQQHHEGASATGANRVLFEYLGNPVEPPADMDPAYSKDGLTQSIQTAARNAGVSVERIEIDDSEFPFLVGVVCKPGDYPKISDQIRKLDRYEYRGSVGTETCNVMNIVPTRAFPPNAAQSINHRTMLRQQIMFDKMQHPVN